MSHATLWSLVAVLSTTFIGTSAHGQTCLGSLSKTEYVGGFLGGDVFSSSNVSIPVPTPNVIKLNLGQTAGWAVSQIVSTEVPNGTVGDYTIGKIFIHAAASFSVPCPPGASLGGTSSTRVDLSFSVDNGITYYPVTFPPGTTTTGDVLIDPLALGIVANGYWLVWRATLLASNPACQPSLTELAVGYEAMYKGIYQTTEPIPAGNVMVRSSYELPAFNWADQVPRGHLQAKLLYSLDTAPLTDYTDPMHVPPNAWASGDAAATISYLPPTPPGTGPDLRQIYFGAGAGNPSPFQTVTAGLYDLVLPNAIRGVTFNAQLVYDFDVSGTVDDGDAGWLINWVRGWATGSFKSSTKSWGLGAIYKSSPAIVGPPGYPWWLSLNGTPATERALFGVPCATAVPFTYLQQQRTRNTLAIVGSRDGLYHAFDLGRFRWCDDPGTTILETRGWFASAGARNYGDGHEVWAYAPPGQLNAFRKQPSRASLWSVESGLPPANTDAAIAVADICVGPNPPVPFPPGGNPNCVFKTVMVAAETRHHPFVTALDITDPTASPKPMWNEDWPPAVENDTTFQGTEASLPMGPTLTRAAGRRWEIATTSGIGTILNDLYLYLIDIQSGSTFNNFGVRDGWGRVQLNVAGGNANCTGQVHGSAGPPVMVDSDTDGVVDRVYVVDTKGCLYKVETATMTPCVLAALGETVYSPMAVRVAQDVTARVQIFVGGGDNPDALDLGAAPARFHLFGLEDDDVSGGCTVPKSLFTVDLTPGNPAPGIVHKLWSAPVVSDDAVYVGTAVGDLNDPCGDPLNPGVLQAWEITPNALAGPKQLLAPVTLAGNVVGGIRLYDGHLFANSQKGVTTVFGRPSSWATSVTSIHANGGRMFSTPLWQER